MRKKEKARQWSVQHEHEIAKEWQMQRATHPSKKKLFSIDTPPPYPSGKPWHIGALAHYAQIDMIARTARMQGFDVYFPLGIDRNGLPVELYTEKKHQIKGHAIPREQFVKLCAQSLDELEAEMLAIMRNAGLSCDFEHCYRTDSPEYRALTQSSFIELWNRGLIYEATRPNNWCPGCRTTIADAEIVYEERPAELVYIKFKAGDKDITIATTRPELLCACQAILINPDDERHRALIAKKATIPFYGREVEIRGHASVDPEFGTGIVMACSYGDYSDVRIFRELGLKEIVAIDDKGKLTKAAGNYAGLGIKAARQSIIADLEQQGLLEKRQSIMHSVPICERCKTEIEIASMPEFYLKQLDLLDTIRTISRKLHFYPEMHRRILLDWLQSISFDWPISRRRFYGTEIPVWYCKRCKKPSLPKADYRSYWQPWKQAAPFSCSCGSREFIGETRTFDTWFDSSITPLFITRFKRDKAFFKRTFPCTIRPQGKEIVRTWLYYTLLRCYQLTGKPAFKHAWIMGWGVDEKGEKMSKAKGNVIDPSPLLERYGADALRFWAATEASLGYDFRCSEQRIAAASKFINKLFNIVLLVSKFKSKRPKKLTTLDSWILAELSSTVKECLNGYKQFNFFIPSSACRKFLWNVFADHYLELVKPRAYAGDASACWTLQNCLKASLILLSPITPFICHWAYKKLYDKDISLERFPKPEKIKAIPFTTQQLQELNSAIWKAKKDKGLSLKAGMSKAIIPKQFKLIEQDLKACHGIKELQFADVKEARLFL